MKILGLFFDWILSVLVAAFWLVALFVVGVLFSPFMAYQWVKRNPKEAKEWAQAILFLVMISGFWFFLLFIS